MTAPITDPDAALREEKVRQIMRDTKQDNFILFNHGIANTQLKNDSVYQNALRLQLWNRIINIRRENRKLGLFKIDKDMSPAQVLIGIAIVCGIIWLILLIARYLGRVRGYLDDSLINAILVIANDMLVLALILTVFNIIALYNIMLSL